MIFYCDEAGNTGSNWKDKDQENFIFSGILISDNNIQNITNIVNKYKLKYGVNELHGKNFKSSKRQIAIFEFITEILKADAIPFFSIANKKYLMVAKFIEFIFDSEFNPMFQGTYDYANPIKERLVELTYSDESLQKDILDFVDMYLTLNAFQLSNFLKKGIFEKLLNSFILFLKRNKFGDISKRLANFDYDHFKREITSSDQQDNFSKRLNYTILHTLLSNVEQWATDNNETVVIQPDAISNSYDTDLQLYDKYMFSDSQRSESKNGKTIYHTLSHIEKIKPGGDSKSIIPLQAADFLCTGLLKINKIKDNANNDLLNYINEFNMLMTNISLNRNNPIINYNLMMCRKDRNKYLSTIFK